MILRQREVSFIFLLGQGTPTEGKGSLLLTSSFYSEVGLLSPKSDLSSTIKCDQIHRIGCCKFCHTSVKL
jgi:hypothetical protein